MAADLSKQMVKLNNQLDKVIDKREEPMTTEEGSGDRTARGAQVGRGRTALLGTSQGRRQAHSSGRREGRLRSALEALRETWLQQRAMFRQRPKNQRRAIDETSESTPERPATSVVRSALRSAPHRFRSRPTLGGLGATKARQGIGGHQGMIEARREISMRSAP